MAELSIKPIKIIPVFRAALGSLLQRKVRSLLSMLGVVCGVAAVVSMIAIGQGARQAAVREIEQLGTRNIFIRAVDQTETQLARSRAQRSYGLADADIARLRKGCPLLTGAAGLRIIPAAVMDLPREQTYEVAGCTATYFELLNLPLSAGRLMVPADEQRKNLVCVLGSRSAREMGEAGYIGRHIRIEADLFKVVGVLQPMACNRKASAISARDSNAMIFLPLAATRGLFRADRPSDAQSDIHQQLDEIVVQVGRVAAVPAAAHQIERILQVAHHGVRDYQIVVPLELLKQAERTHHMFSLVLGAIAAISLLVGGIGIMNIMLATVTERTREIGIRRAVGASRRQILAQFLAEAILLTVSGGALGILCGLIATGLIILAAGWPMAVTVWGLALPLLMALMVGLFSGIYPARKAARVDPMVALRHQG